ncbi:MAG: Hsp33 family molecular chaperone HslO [Solobacterium sp.]|nr:Hsp33 family molecular chaperone HslO [Solobacterium sp.]
MENKILIGTALNDRVRFYLGDTTKLVDEARKIHDMWPTSLAALGRVMSVTACMGLMQKGEDETVTVNINGGGSIGTIMCVANSKGEVKGFVGDPQLYLKYNSNNKLAVGLVVGKDGYLKVIKNLSLKQNYTSQVKLQSGEIGDDFAYYFAASEQTPAIVSVGVLVNEDYSCKSAGVLLIELLPNHTEEDVEYLEKLLKDLEPISSVLDRDRDLNKYLHTLFTDAKVLEERNVEYKCDCSRERFMASLLTLPKKDIEDLSKEEKIEVHCEFCNKRYEYSKEDLQTVLSYADRKCEDN